jgi:hypothetical protein
MINSFTCCIRICYLEIILTIARIGAAGALHHIFVGGIERRKIIGAENKKVKLMRR